MKLLVMFAFMFSCFTAYAAESISQEPTIQKLYIDPANVIFDSHEIHVCVDSNWMTTDAVFTDVNGFYINADKGGWNCPRCQNWETTNLFTCSKCGYQR